MRSSVGLQKLTLALLAAAVGMPALLNEWQQDLSDSTGDIGPKEEHLA